MNENNSYVLGYQFEPVRVSLSEHRESDDQNKEINATARLIIH